MRSVTVGVLPDLDMGKGGSLEIRQKLGKFLAEKEPWNQPGHSFKLKRKPKVGPLSYADEHWLDDMKLFHAEVAGGRRRMRRR